ncbi:transporter [Gordonia alkaliphila]|uniref:PH-like domain-containing protein n=1 Tax=Gordonia alkaliphila TaxID=1053547 RepID=UPI001FF1CE45|nr:transporter [Gordonia alkaliphila]MCK0440563.1 transporter [Gordonia alkaliphila]
MSPWLVDVLIVGGVALFWLFLIWLGLRGWRKRGRAQADQLGELPVVPDELGEVLDGPDTGLYVGSTLAPTWATRVAVKDFGDRALVHYSRYAEGILLDRTGASPIWIPTEAITAVRTESGLAGKVMSRDGLLAIRWRLPSGVEVDSGIRGDDKSVYPAWTTAYADITERTRTELDAADAVGTETKRKKA